MTKDQEKGWYTNDVSYKKQLSLYTIQERLGNSELNIEEETFEKKALMCHCF